MNKRKRIRKKRKSKIINRFIVLIILLLLSCFLLGDRCGLYRNIKAKRIDYKIGKTRYYNKKLEDLNANSVLLYRLDDDKVLYNKNVKEKIKPASITKLFVIDYALNILDLEKEVTVGREIDLVKEGSSLAGLIKGETYKVSELIEGMLISSGNDAAYSLALECAREISANRSINEEKGIEIFLDSLSKYLSTNGYNNTKITEVSGFSYNDYSSMSDVYKVTDKLLKNDFISNVVGLDGKTITSKNGKSTNIYNTNKFVNKSTAYYDKNISGVKTGSLKDYNNIIIRYNKNNKTYYIFVFGSSTDEDRYKDSVKIMESLNS